MAIEKSLSPVGRSAVLLIRTYQKLLSPLLGQHCRFYPSCSQYTLEAIQEWGLVKGSWLGAKRISRCHPLNEGGIDPVPRRSPLPQDDSTLPTTSSLDESTQPCDLNAKCPEQAKEQTAVQQSATLNAPTLQPASQDTLVTSDDKTPKS